MTPNGEVAWFYTKTNSLGPLGTPATLECWGVGRVGEGRTSHHDPQIPPAPQTSVNSRGRSLPLLTVSPPWSGVVLGGEGHNGPWHDTIHIATYNASGAWPGTRQPGHGIHIAMCIRGRNPVRSSKRGMRLYARGVSAAMLSVAATHSWRRGGPVFRTAIPDPRRWGQRMLPQLKIYKRCSHNISEHAQRLPQAPLR